MRSRFFAVLIVALTLIGSSASAQSFAPVLDPIGAQSVDENSSLPFTVTASDGDLTTPTLTSSTLPAGASYTDNLNGTASFSWTPDFSQSGIYNVTFYANDAVTADIDSEQVVITVNNVNQLPVLASIGAQSTDENLNLSFGTSASDADGTTPTLTSTTLPTGASYTDNLNGTGSFSWTPDFTQSGTYPVTFYADDGVDTDSEQVVITVNNVNQLPVLAAIGAQSTDENLNLSFGTSASDADGTTPTLT
ncbi:MAG: Ig-like domain-containing protein, partial [bacterium]|nr:Ig-like domain-containing protein [bacterium]